MFEWLDLSAVLWGLLASLGIAAIGGAIVGGTAAAKDPSDDEEFDFSNHPAIWKWIFGLTALSSFAGGALTARLSEYDPLANAATLAVLYIAIHFRLMDDEAPAWLNRSAFVVMPVALFAGAFLVTGGKW